MVPTELLAVQHYDHLLSLLENFEDDSCKPSVALLTGSTPSKQIRLILKACTHRWAFTFLNLMFYKFYPYLLFNPYVLLVNRVFKREKLQWSLERTV